MRNQIAIFSGLMAVLVGPLGCTASYNATMGFGDEERAEILDYREGRGGSPNTANSAQTGIAGRPAHAQTARGTIAPPIPSPQLTNAVTLPNDSRNPGGAVQNAGLSFADPAAQPVVELSNGQTAQPAAPRDAVFKVTSPVSPDAANADAPPTPASTRPADPRRTGLHRFGELDDLQIAQASPLDAQGNLRRVTFTHEGADFDVELDPTGRWLAYASTRHRHTADIYLQRVDGTAVTQLTNDPANDVMPCISPDGKQVVFASDRAGTWDLYLMDIAGGPAIKLTEDGAQNIHPSFSPDGQQIVYSSRGSQSGVWELILIDVDQPSHRRIIGHGLFPVWSPTGNTIAYQRARERGSRWFSVWTVQITEEGDAVRPTEIAASSNAAIITPEWSPDGRSIVFCTVLDPTADSPAGSRADIWVCNADGSGRSKLTHGDFGNLYPTWAADGTIYFVSNRGVDAIENVYAIKPDQAVHLARQGTRPDPQENVGGESGEDPGQDSGGETLMEATVPTPINE